MAVLPSCGVEGASYQWLVDAGTGTDSAMQTRIALFQEVAHRIRTTNSGSYSTACPPSTYEKHHSCLLQIHSLASLPASGARGGAIWSSVDTIMYEM